MRKSKYRENEATCSRFVRVNKDLRCTCYSLTLASQDNGKKPFKLLIFIVEI